MLLTEKTRSILESAQKKMVVLFRLKIVKPLPPKKTFLSQFWADARGREKGKVKTIFSFGFGQDSLIFDF